MAALAIPMYPSIPFGEVEEGVTHVSVGVRRASKWATIFRLLYQASVLSYELNHTIHSQGELIDRLNGMAMQDLQSSVYLELAVRIEKLISLNDALLEGGNTANFSPWARLFEKMRTQRNNLEGIAESYRCAADYEATALFGLASEAVGV